VVRVQLHALVHDFSVAAQAAGCTQCSVVLVIKWDIVQW
jgi:hypothetical protein